MIANSSEANRVHWQNEAARVARKMNLGWWLEALSAPLVVGAVCVTIALVVTRREIPEVNLWFLLGWVAAAFVVLSFCCFLVARRNFEKPADSMVRMEAAMCLRNALSAAQAGVATWPQPVQKIDAGISWQWGRLLVPVLGALVLLVAGFIIPVSSPAGRVALAPEEPQAWQQLSAELDRLTEEKIVDENYLEETRQRLDELKAQEQEQWFSHSSLEATDSLKKSHQSEAGRVTRELARAEKALATLEQNAGGMAAAERNRLMNEFDQALQGLQSGAMKPDAALLEQMKQLDLKQLANLTPEQLQQLRENLKKHGEAMKGEEGGDELADGEGEGDEGEPRDGEGSGGVNRGPGHADGVLGKEKDEVLTGEHAGIEAKDLSQTTPGDLLELQDGEHDVDETASRIRSGGNTDATGKGGDRVWRDALDPAEQQTLKRFFE
ncbi:MAG: hypothetical protein V4640_15920 [Verrucomicrobiota bacterium]